VEDLAGLYWCLVLQPFAVQLDAGTHRLEDPVSKITVNGWGGKGVRKGVRERACGGEPDHAHHINAHHLAPVIIHTMHLTASRS
jgi:hypothetical protein